MLGAKVAVNYFTEHHMLKGMAEVSFVLIDVPISGEVKI